MTLRDGYLYELTPAELISWVSTVTLARISEMTNAELIRIGWLGNPLVDILYSMTSAGVWIARTDASGRLTEANSGDILSGLNAGWRPAGVPQQQVTTDDTPVTVIAAGKYGMILGWHQTSGVALDLILLTGATEITGRGSVGSGAYQGILNPGIGSILKGPISAKWSAAAGATQWVSWQEYDI